MVGVMATSLRRTYASTRSLLGVLQSVPLTLQQAVVHPRPQPETPKPHRQVWLSLLWGHLSFVLGPGAHKVLFVPSKSLSFPSLVEVL